MSARRAGRHISGKLDEIEQLLMVLTYSCVNELSVWLFPSRGLCRSFDLSGKLLQPLEKLAACLVGQYQSACDDPPHFWRLTSGGLIDPNGGQRYGDVAVDHSYGGGLASENLPFVQRVFKWWKRGLGRGGHGDHPFLTPCYL